MIPKRVAWLVPNPRLARLRLLMGYQPWHPDVSMASVWIRGFQIASYLMESGFEVVCNRVNPLPEVAIFLRRYSASDVYLAQRLKENGVKIIVDVVANYFEAREGDGVGDVTSTQVENFLKMIALADQVWTVSPFLQQVASQCHAAVQFVSDSVDPRLFYPNLNRQYDFPGIIRLGWAGVSAKAVSLKAITPILEPLIQTKKVELALMSNRRVELNLSYRFNRWRYMRFPDFIRSCALCVAPRDVQSDYDRGHSLFKIGVFMAMGIPALAGPVPSYDLLLSDGQAGAICNTLEDWSMQLLRYVEDHEMRRTAGLTAIERMRPYLTPVIARQIIDLLNSM